MRAMVGLRTLVSSGFAELPKIKGSRFIAGVCPILTEEQARMFLLAARAKHPKATHHCLAFRCGTVARASDDGEPSGTAGRPILAQLDAAGIENAAAVVVRYYGGRKLGAGGLARAYGAATRAALVAGEFAPLQSGNGEGAGGRVIEKVVAIAIGGCASSWRTSRRMRSALLWSARRGHRHAPPMPALVTSAATMAATWRCPEYASRTSNSDSMPRQRCLHRKNRSVMCAIYSAACSMPGAWTRVLLQRLQAWQPRTQKHSSISRLIYSVSKGDSVPRAGLLAIIHTVAAPHQCVTRITYYIYFSQQRYTVSPSPVELEWP